MSHSCCSNCAALALRGKACNASSHSCCRKGFLSLILTDSRVECSALKTVLGESCDAVAQAQSMSYLNLAWGLGTILGPVIGGYFVYPCDGALSHDSYFCQHGSLLRTRYTTVLASQFPRNPPSLHTSLFLNAQLPCTGADLAAR